MDALRQYWINRLRDCVVLRADVFEQIKKLLPDFDPRDAYPAVDEVMSEDWNDPKLAEYDEYGSLSETFP